MGFGPWLVGNFPSALIFSFTGSRNDGLGQHAHRLHQAHSHRVPQVSPLAASRNPDYNIVQDTRARPLIPTSVISRNFLVRTLLLFSKRHA